MDIGVEQSNSILQLPSEVHTRPSNTVVKCPLPGDYYESFKMFKISPSEFDTVSMLQMNASMHR